MCTEAHVERTWTVHSKHASAFLLDLFFNISWKIKEERTIRKEERREENSVTVSFLAGVRYPLKG